MLLCVPLCRRHRDLLLRLIFPGAQWWAKSRLVWRREMVKRSQANFESRENQMYACRRLESKMALTVSIFDHNVNNVSSFKYLGIFISPDFTLTNHVEYIAGKINQRLGLLNRIKHLLPFSARLLFYNSLVMPLFDYADLVWGDKHNVTVFCRF